MNASKDAYIKITPEEIEQGYQHTIHLFKKVHPEIPDVVLDDFRSVTGIESYKRNTCIVDYGELCRKLYIVIKGYVIIYLQIDGIEKPVWFIDAGELTVAVQSYLYKVPSRERQMVVKDTVFIVLDRDKYQELYDRHPAFQKLIAQFFQLYFFEALFRIELSHYEPEARYRRLLEVRPDIVMNATIADLAKYLGIAKRTLNRKRAKLTSGKK